MAHFFFKKKNFLGGNLDSPIVRKSLKVGSAGRACTKLEKREGLLRVEVYFKNIKIFQLRGKSRFPPKNVFYNIQYRTSYIHYISSAIPILEQTESGNRRL